MIPLGRCLLDSCQPGQECQYTPDQIFYFQLNMLEQLFFKVPCQEHSKSKRGGIASCLNNSVEIWHNFATQALCSVTCAYMCSFRNQLRAIVVVTIWGSSPVLSPSVGKICIVPSPLGCVCVQESLPCILASQPPEAEAGKFIFHIEVEHIHGSYQRAPNPRPNLHSPVWVGSKGGRPQRGGTNLGVFVPIWPVMRMPG